MYANPHAGGEPQDEVFGPVEDGEEVFEWIDDTDAEDGLETAAAEQPAPTLRERMAALRAGARRLRGSRREIAAFAAAIVLACAVGGGFTAWFDHVANAADRAGVVALTVNSVVDGDPGPAKYDAKQTSATGEYVVELANNSPGAVTLTSVSFNAGFLGASSGWKPVGGSTPIPGGGTGEVIPGGGTGKVVLSVRLFCPMVIRVTQSGYYGSSDATPISFPALHVGVLDGKGEAREVVLPTRVSTSSQSRARTGGSTFLSGEDVAPPQIVSADAGICRQWESDREALLIQDPNRDVDQEPASLAFSYDGLVEPLKDRSFTVSVTLRNTTGHALMVSTVPSEQYVQNPEDKTTWLPNRMDLGAGQSRSAQVRVTVADCRGWTPDPAILGFTMLEVEDRSTGFATTVYPNQALTGSVRLANDVAQQMTAVCR
ncbi:MAG: hypothetical protein AUG49_04335 [Catenulispora sp. 13_1_20CM_3_70_7]|nr:MAG: hypothetical protein AUG49_04335 [Catenulispora sp. 13_1_20CM_3_70_7]